jgi:hypothetical protein
VGKRLAPEASVVTINGPGLEAANTFAAPNQVLARRSVLKSEGGQWTHTFEKHSVTILSLKMEK